MLWVFTHGYLQSNNEARANILNQQFVSALTRENTTYIPDMGQSETPSMSNITVDWKGVHKLLMNLNTKKATGPDEIPTFMLKAAATELAPALANLFQRSLDLGEVPQDWREVSVVPQERRPPPSIQFIRGNLRECTPPVKEASYKAMAAPNSRMPPPSGTHTS